MSTMTFETDQWNNLSHSTCQSISWKVQSLHFILLWVSQALLFILQYHLEFDFFFYSSALFRYQSASSSFGMDHLSRVACRYKYLLQSNKIVPIHHLKRYWLACSNYQNSFNLNLHSQKMEREIHSTSTWAKVYILE